MSGTHVAPRLEIPARPGVAGPVHPGPVLLIGAMFLAPVFLDEYWTFNVVVGLTLAIGCLGLQVLWGWARQISLMQAGLVGSATYICSRVSIESHDRKYGSFDPRWWWEPVPDGGSPWLVGFLTAAVFCVGLSLAVGLMARRMVAAYVVALSFAVQFAIEQTIFTSPRFSGGLAERIDLPRPSPFGMSLGSNTRLYYAVGVVLLVVLLCLHRLRLSRYGRAIAFVGQQPDAAAAVGISPARFRTVAWAVAGFCAAVAGWTQDVVHRNPPSVLNYVSVSSVLYMAVVVLAGSVSLLAVVVVALTVQLLPQVLLDWRVNVYLIGGIGMAIGILLGSRGVGGLVIDLYNPRRSRWQI